MAQVVSQLPSLLGDASRPNAVDDAVAALPQLDTSTATDPVLLQALMRDYSILVSAFLLEGKTKCGAPRTVVPCNVAIPFAVVARALQEPMIM